MSSNRPNPKKNKGGYEVLIVVAMNSIIFWDVTCSLAEVH
jgi:hypothetical protein